MNLTKTSKARPNRRYKVHMIAANGAACCGARSNQETIEEIDCLHCLKIIKKYGNITLAITVGQDTPVPAAVPGEDTGKGENVPPAVEM